MDGPEILIPLGFFIFLGVVIVTPVWLRERTKQSAHRLLSEAIARGEKVDPELISRLSDPPRRRQDRSRETLGSALILIALSAAFIGMGFVDSGGFGLDWQIYPASILGALGLAFLILAIVDYRSKRNEPPRAE
ncbi:MAG: hypothetical protein GC206_02705 [Alphaproteobacteria bacterium]|nr:hypothetical protein [Alphaproteobacteria bacterium]